jgi:hypothetical protein
MRPSSFAGAEGRLANQREIGTCNGARQERSLDCKSSMLCKHSDFRAALAIANLASPSQTPPLAVHSRLPAPQGDAGTAH